MIDRNSIPPMFRPISYSGISNFSGSETNVVIKNGRGEEVRIIKMNTHIDGRVEIEMDEITEAPFQFSRF